MFFIANVVNLPSPIGELSHVTVIFLLFPDAHLPMMVSQEDSAAVFTSYTIPGL
jgi:hypothetical protein